MQNKLYWIKLYLDILDDPKMGMLDSDTFRFAIQLFLYAGEYNQGGSLPSEDVISWRLRIPQEDILAALCTLEQVGITTRDEAGNWHVTNFAIRQAAVSGADRSRLYRNRREDRHDDRYASRDDDDDIHRDVPVAPPRDESALDTESDTESDKDPEKELVSDSHTPGQAYFARLFKSQPTPAQLLTLAQLEKTHGYYRLTQVIDWAISSGIPPGRALRAICTAITAWSDHPPPPRSAGRARRTGALEKLRKELSGDFDA